jgi:hypothetical protein
LRGWADYVAQAPDELTSILTVMPAPPAPFIPADQVGQLVAVVGVVHVGDLEAGQRVVDPLRQLATPIADLTGPMPYPAIFALTREAEHPAFHVLRSGYMRTLDDDTLESIVDHTARLPLPTGMVQIRGLGGAMARVPSSATAFAHRDAAFMTTVIGGGQSMDEVEQQRTWTEDLWGVLRPRASGVYVNFLEDEGSDRVREAYSPATYERLVAVKQHYDPTNLFRLNQNINPTGERS